MPVETIIGHQVSWREWPAGNGAAARPPALALHCSLAHGGAWGALATALSGGAAGAGASAGAPIGLIAPDLPGHGASAPPNPGEDFHALSTRIATEMARRIAKAGRGVDLIGHSFGGTVALRLALENPGLVRSLTLVEPVIFAAARGTPSFAPCRKMQEEVAGLLAENPDAGTALFHSVWGAGLPYDALPAAQRAYMRDRMYLVTGPGAVLLDDAAGLLRDGGLEGLTMPVLLAEGAKSPPVVAAILDTLERRLPNVRRLRVTGAAHMLPLTHAAVLAPAVRDLILSA